MADDRPPKDDPSERRVDRNRVPFNPNRDTAFSKWAKQRGNYSPNVEFRRPQTQDQVDLEEERQYILGLEGNDAWRQENSILEKLLQRVPPPKGSIADEAGTGSVGRIPSRTPQKWDYGDPNALYLPDPDVHPELGKEKPPGYYNRLPNVWGDRPEGADLPVDSVPQFVYGLIANAGKSNPRVARNGGFISPFPMPEPRPAMPEMINDAGVPDIGKQRYGSRRNVPLAPKQLERVETGRALRGVAEQADPEKFLDAVSRMPESTNIQDRRNKRERTPTPLPRARPSDPFAPHPVMPQQSNLPMAEAQMNLTPQEQALYMRHLYNLYSPGGITNPNGSRSTLMQAGVNIDGKEYNIPTVYDGRFVPIDEAIQRAQAQGMHKFPSYNTPEEAEARYQQMHKFMERDVPQPDPAEEIVNKTIQGEE